MIANSIYKTIGRTPLVKINHMTTAEMAEVWVKVEGFNPAGSVKDRPAFYMIKDAEERGILKKGSTIIEPTSGNTGIALAMIGAAKGYKVIIVMPDTMSMERRKLMAAYGAELILTEGKYGMKGSVELAKKLASREGYFMPNQFGNINNVIAHYETTGIEILEDTKGNIDAFVVGVGTGGTITGVGRRLKENNTDILIVAVEPSKSPILSGGNPSSHGIQGIGANFIPEILDRNIIDEIITVDDKDAFIQSRRLGKEEGIFCGISSGANIHAAITIAKRLGKGKKVVTVLPDTGERYLSTALFNEE
ncbi:cysteine synthase A [Tepidimicrobium xylanilyticum]|uniref:Cysteine synthase n=1 Tax=Tepidimicrobium xylanilyticum TaxID=1123352 RepID=A0A1H3BEU2_9FIRM|nr:cysteine synthase A [Tepidimicrobium xylanilyticum]SDX39579.1 cysteine synthase A [Tepidimicrobium xylanilyticum]